jgi:hypothetical protein
MARRGSSFSRFGGQSYASRRYNTAPKPMWGKPAAGAVLVSRGSPAKVRSAATALLQPIMEAADTARVLPTAEPTRCPAIASPRPMAAADTVRILPTAEATAETAPFPAFASAVPTKNFLGFTTTVYQDGWRLKFRRASGQVAFG